MKTLTCKETSSVSGGSNFIVTQRISAADVSNKCLTTLSQIDYPSYESNREALIIKVLGSCTVAEIGKLIDRQESANFRTLDRA